MKKLKISRLTPDSRYLQTVALKALQTTVYAFHLTKKFFCTVLKEKESLRFSHRIILLSSYTRLKRNRIKGSAFLRLLIVKHASRTFVTLVCIKKL